MRNLRSRFLGSIYFAVVLLTVCISASAQQASQNRVRYDITNYRIEAQLLPEQHILRAGADITLTPLEATRSVVFELNGALKVEKIERNGQQLTNFVQDSAGVDAIVEAQRRVALNYFEDGSVEAACPPRPP